MSESLDSSDNHPTAATPTRSGSDSWTGQLLRPVDSTWLALYRIGFGACMLWTVWRKFSTDRIYNFFIEPQHHLTWYGFDWVQPWPGDGMYLHFFVLGVAATCIMLGFYYRVATAVFCVGFTHAFLIDKSYYLNHNYLICLLSFIGIFLPASCRMSLDALRYPEGRSDTVPAWTLWLLRFQLGVPYFFGGIAKLNWDWIYGEPMRRWLMDRSHYALGSWEVGQHFTKEPVVQMFVWGGLLLDLLIIPLLLWKRTRVAMMIWMTSFHALNFWLFNIGIFPWLMLIATLVVFASPERTAALGKCCRTALPIIDREPDRPSMRRKLLGGFLCLYVTWQLLMPLRHFFYGTHTAFTREGHYFSWRMKLNDRFLSADSQGKFPPAFAFYDPKTRVQRIFPLHLILTNIQVDKIRESDQILLVSRWISEAIEDRYPGCEVRASVFVALNGRSPQQLLDPKLDLLSVPRSFGPARWISQEANPRYLQDLPVSDEQQGADAKQQQETTVE